MSAADAIQLLRHDSVRRRMIGLNTTMVLAVCGLLVYVLVTTRLVPGLTVPALLAGVGVLAIAAAGPRLTFPLYYATWFGYGFSVPGLPIFLNRVLGAAYVLSVVVSFARRRFRIPNTPAVYLLAVYTLYAVTAGLLLKVPTASPVTQPLLYLFVTLTVASVFRTREDFVVLAGTIVAITCAISSVGLAEFFIGRDLFPEWSDFINPDDRLRINGVSRTALQFAFLAVWAIPWALFLHIEARRPGWRLLSLVAILFLMAVAVLTFNRQTPIIIGAMLIVGISLIRHRYRPLLAVVMLLAAAILAPVVAQRIVERFQSVGSEGRRDMSFAIRYDKFLACREAIRAHPLVGIGLTNFKDVWPDYRVPGEMYIIHFERQTGHHVDLGYLQLLTETGVLGVLQFGALIAAAFGLWWKSIRRAWRLATTLNRNALAACAMGFTQLLVSLLLQDTFFTPHSFLLFGLLFAQVTLGRDQAVAEWESRHRHHPPADRVDAGPRKSRSLPDDTCIEPQTRGGE